MQLNGSNSTPPPHVPLSQPLLINTSMSAMTAGVGGHQTAHLPGGQHAMVTQIPAGQAVPQGSIISAIRMPQGMTQGMPTIIRQPGVGHPGVPIIMNQMGHHQMPQIALPNGSILQPVTVTSAPTMMQGGQTMLRHPFVYGAGPHMMALPTQAPPGGQNAPTHQQVQQQVSTSGQQAAPGFPTVSVSSAPLMMQQAPASGLQVSTPYSTAAGAQMQVAHTMTKCNTDVTSTNTQPLVSPGPPLLSPQFQQHLANNAPPAPKTPAGATPTTTQGANTATPSNMAGSLVRGPPLRPPLATGPRGLLGGAIRPMQTHAGGAIPPVLTPSGLPVTSGAVIRSVLPNIKGKTQFARMPSASGGPCQVTGSPQNIRATVPTPPTPNTSTHTPVSTSISNVSSSKPNSKPIFTNKNQNPPTPTSSTPNNPVNNSSPATTPSKSQQQGGTKGGSSSGAATPSTPSSANKSFRVDDESSPYAFEPEPLEIRPSVSYRKKTETKPDKTGLQEKQQQQTPIPASAMTQTSSKSTSTSSVTKTASNSSKKTKQEKSLPDSKPDGADTSKQPKLDDFNLKDINSSISLPAELATQLAAQAQAEGASSSGSKETTYFIPLQNNASGQSFGVAVKLGTEGPPGPDQKVIMKAKLVTQPVGKASEKATVISAPSSAAKKGGQKGQDSAKKGQSKAKTVIKQEESSSSSSDESSDDDSEFEEPIKKKAKYNKKKPNLVSPKSEQLSPTPTAAAKRGPKKEATVIALPVTSPRVDSSRSQQTCLGVVESLDKFPKLGQHAHLIEAPIFKPTPAEFKDPIKYIQGIRKIAEPFGMCKIIPPSSFKPECNVDDDMRFTGNFFSEHIFLPFNLI